MPSPFRSLVLCLACVVPGVVMTSSTARAEFEPLPAPRRLVDTRPGEPTFDGLNQGDGRAAAEGTYTVQVAGRAGIPQSASTVVLNVTATEGLASGFVTVTPCSDGLPRSSNLNFEAGQTIANTVVARLSSDGKVCLYTHQPTHLVVDVAGTLPTDTYRALDSPQRLADTRPGEFTADSDFLGAGVRAPQSTYKVKVAGRVGVPSDATSAVLNLTSTGSATGGFVTAFPCGAIPNASNLNFSAGQTIANTVVARLDENGDVCLFNNQSTHLILDIAGTMDEGGGYTPAEVPLRLTDTRPGELTFDGNFSGAGIRPATGTYPVLVTGRGDIPADATGVVLNVTSTQAAAPGFLTAHPRGTDRPTASNLNFDTGQIVANTVFAKVGAGGQVCFYTHTSSHVIVDIAGYTTGGNASTPSGDCPADPPPPPTPAQTFQPGQYLVGSQIPAGRYEASGQSGCYWERQSGLGGSFDEINANEFNGFAGRVLVDVAASDVGFEFDDECGPMTSYRSGGSPAASIVAGDHVVGTHITAGTYRAQAGSGCYWERLTGFSGSLDDIIANEFVGTAGQQFVTIEASDVGFSTDDECGTWTKVS